MAVTKEKTKRKGDLTIRIPPHIVVCDKCRISNTFHTIDIDETLYLICAHCGHPINTKIKWRGKFKDDSN